MYFSWQTLRNGSEDLLYYFRLIDKLGSRSKVYLKSLIRDLDLELVAIIAMPPPPPPPTRKLF